MCIWKHFYLHETIASKKLRALTQLLFFNFCRSRFHRSLYFSFFLREKLCSIQITYTNMTRKKTEEVWHWFHFFHRKMYSYILLTSEKRCIDFVKVNRIIFDVNWKEIKFVWTFENSNSAILFWLLTKNILRFFVRQDWIEIIEYKFLFFWRKIRQMHYIKFHDIFSTFIKVWWGYFLFLTQ